MQLQRVYIYIREIQDQQRGVYVIEISSKIYKSSVDAVLEPSRLQSCILAQYQQSVTSLVLFLLLLYVNLSFKCRLVFSQLILVKQILKVLVLLNYYINSLTFKLNTLFTQDYFRPYLFFKVLAFQKYLFRTYLYIFKLSYCPFLLVFVYYRS